MVFVTHYFFWTASWARLEDDKGAKGRTVVTAILDCNCSESHGGSASLHSHFLIYNLITQRVCLSLVSFRITDLTKEGFLEQASSSIVLRQPMIPIKTTVFWEKTGRLEWEICGPMLTIQQGAVWSWCGYVAALSAFSPLVCFTFTWLAWIVIAPRSILEIVKLQNRVPEVWWERASNHEFSYFLIFKK